MPAAIRNTGSDLSTGHGLAGPRPPKQGSSDVFINNLQAVRVLDLWVDHHVPPTDDEYVASNSTNVYINNRQAVRSGDGINCGDTTNLGSPDVFYN